MPDRLLSLLSDRRVINKKVILYQYSFFCKSLNSLKILNSRWFFECIKITPASTQPWSRPRAAVRRRAAADGGGRGPSGGMALYVYGLAHGRGF